MNKSKKILLGAGIMAAVLVALVTGSGGVSFFLGAADELAARNVVQRERRGRLWKGRIEKRHDFRIDNHPREVAIKVDSRLDRSGPSYAEEEGDSLTALEESVLQQLSDAMDADNLKTVRKVIARLGYGSRTRPGSQVHRIVRSEIVSALKWFGASAVEDMMDFATDPDEEIASEALEGVLSALDDVNMGDRQRAELVKTFLHSMNDEGSVETLVDELMNMRNSVKAETAIDILKNGTEAAKERLSSELETHFDEGVATVDDIVKWALQNPDDPDDAEFYDGAKN